ncbi:MAG TPA: AgmX/PglI C-terminal domain-containing protein, partial [Kofleriaceae bacterium]
ADIYALGVILYEMLTARRPFASEDDPRQLLHRIVHEEPPPLMRPEVPHGLAETILGMMLAKNPDDRYQTMSDVEAALESFITRSDGTPVPSRRSQPIPLVDGQHDLNDIARNSKTIPRPAKVANTPYPGSPAATLTPMAMKNVMLTGAAKKPYALYAIAGVGIAVGALGLMFGMRGKKDEVVQTPQPTVQQPQPAAAMPVPKEAQKITVQLDADAPNAHVTFRRHIAGTPTSTQINATDVVELVEVSAPGYKTARYWLTFDRPTHLKAHLAKGTGLAEATEEETLVALGEVSAPAQPALAQKVAATPAPTTAPTARTVEKPRPQAAAPASVVEKIAMAPRKIGKTAVADDIKKIEPAEVPPIVAATEEPKPETKPEPAPTMPEVAKPEKTEEPVAKAVEPPKAEAPVPAVAHPTGIDATTVSMVVGNHKNEVQKCCADGKKKNTSLKGTVSLQRQVDAAGKVHRVQIQSTLKDPLVAACVVKSASAWRFPARAGAEAATVSYPFSVN